MMKKRKSLYISMLVRSALPLLIFGVLAAVFSSKRIAAIIYVEAEESLRALGSSVFTIYDELYPGEYIMTENGGLKKGDYLINGDYHIIDRMKKELGIDITFFGKDTRIITTIRDHSGERIIGTKADEQVKHDVLEKKEAYFYFNIKISENDYFAYYAPIFNSSGDSIGMIFIAKQFKEVRNSIYSMVFPIVVFTLAFMGLIGFVSIRYSKEMIKGFTKIDTFLYKVSQGDLTSAMDGAILEREDEMGDMARHIVDMQKSFKVLIDQDMLTGLANRRCGEHKLILVQKKTLEEKGAFAVAIGDIDYFKRVNDTYGHECGDIVLKNTAGLLQKSMQGKGTAVRWGGEEFLLIYENMDIHRAAKELQILVEAIREASVRYGEAIIKITMTFGLVDGSGEKIDELIRIADDRLYYGKTSGRDRIITDISKVK